MPLSLYSNIFDPEAEEGVVMNSVDPVYKDYAGGKHQVNK